jgi:hypothetical protein
VTRARRLGRPLALLLTAAAALALSAGAARADGDPASDTLLYADLFVPYTQPIPDSVTKRLESTLASAKQRGRPIKAAIIAQPYDLGSVAGLWGKPRQYAPFLGQEDGFGVRDKSLLVVVMPAGFGVYDGTRPTDAYYRKLQGIPPGKSATDLAKAMTTAVERLADVKAPSSGGDSPWRQRLIIGLAALVTLLVMAGVSMLAPRARRRRQAETPQT